jgi:alpha-ketoglutaric semialdehyde dehydrogenase
MDAKILGTSIIGNKRGSGNSTSFRAFDPRTGAEIDPSFHPARLSELDRAAELAGEARISFGNTSGHRRAEFLRRIAENLEALGDEMIERASLETALPVARLQSERGRTCSQLRLFADLIEEGSWVNARIDLADAGRIPLPKPDVRSMLRPIGPVAVFCASNFPLAFSVAGGDTASAFAAGCPVIVMAHPAHPGTAELAGLSIQKAAELCDLPEGVFSLLFANGYDLGQALVRHPAIKAVGFTGSRSGGRTLMDIAAARPEPIPVYAEMSSVNPTFILPGALAGRADEIAAGLHSSFTMGVGQFCTKPGLVFLPDSRHLDRFTEKLNELTAQTAASPLLTKGIKVNYERLVNERMDLVTSSANGDAIAGFFVNAAAFRTSAEEFLQKPELSEEVFGPAILLVTTASRDRLLAIARSMEGQLTASIFGSNDELLEFADLISILETKVGRLIFNGFPTGVEVCHSMVHGGVYPATSDSRSTSVGTLAINRFSRLVCYQGFTQAALPDELKDKNPLRIWRLLDGTFSSEPV